MRGAADRMIDCPHHLPNGRCHLDAFGGAPREVDCLENCFLYRKLHGIGLPPEHELRGIVGDGVADPTLLGNRIEAWAKKVGADKAAEAVERLGIPCGCDWRRDMLNAAHAMARSVIGRMRG